MNLEITAPDRAFLDEVRTFLRENLSADLVRAAELSTGPFPEPEITLEWQRRLHRKGWVAPAWPVAHGGTGWNGVRRYLFDRECQLAGAPALSPMGIRMVGPVILGFGSDEQKRLHLPRILSAEDYWCQGYSEPQAGSDLASLKTRAVRDGDAYVVNGTKIWTTHAQHANRMFALVRTDDSGRKQEGISFLLIDMDSPGLTVRPIHTIGGEPEVNQVFLDDVRVPVANRVGEEGSGWSYGKYLLEFERGGGFSAARLRRHLANVHRAIGDAAQEAATAMRINELETDIEALEMIELQIVASDEGGSRPGVMSSMLKLRTSEIRQAITRLAVDAIGPQALYWEPRRPFHAIDAGRPDMTAAETTPIVSAYLNARAQTIFGGASEVQRDILARTLIG